MSQRILKLCVASLLNILCFPDSKSCWNYQSERLWNMVGCYPTIDWGMWSGAIVNLIRGHGYEGGQGHLVHVEEIKMRPFSFTQVLAINNFLAWWIALLGFGLVWQPCYGRLVCSYLLWEGIQLAGGGAVGGKRIWHDSTSEQIIHLTSREMVNVVKTMMKMVIMMVTITATIKVESRQFELFTVLVFPWINWCHRPHREKRLWITGGLHCSSFSNLW